MAAAGLSLVAAQPLAAQESEVEWSGIYAGIALGAAFNGDDDVRVDPAAVTPGTLEMNGSQAVVSLGYNWGEEGIVWGVEGDIQLGSVEDSVTGGGVSATSKIDKAASIRLRAGLPVLSSGLVYATAGVAVAKLDYTVTGAAPAVAINSDSTEWGYALGAGYEHAMSNGWSLKGEYMYENFGSTTLSDGAQSTKATPDFHTLRLGLNRQF
ncbi:outer membrane protein [Phaeovulum vinaykumarii]|nr:outer membrane beta-barrel protein [Phaeovulum vinaykumarii]